MELLNNIWVALSTPNQELTNIFLIIMVFFFETPLSLVLFSSVLNIKSTLKQKLTYIISLSVVSILSMLVISQPLNTFFNYITTFILIYFIFKLSFLKTLIATILPTVAFAIINTLLLNPFITFFSITFEEAQIIPIFRISYLLITYSMVALLILILKCKNFKISILEDFDSNSKLILLINLLLGIFTLGIQLIVTNYYTDTLPILITFLSFLTLLAYFFISIYSLTRVIKLNITEKRLESAEEYNKTLHILHDNVRGFKHDFDNIVTTIGGYITTDDMKGLKNYYLQLEDDCERVNNLYILNPDVVNNPGIYNLLTSKYHEAEDKGIRIKLSFFLNLEELHIKIYEFARILGILLDNAIEASSECPEDKKVMNIIFRKEAKKNRNVVIIENSYKNKDVNIEKIFDKGNSEKENHSGLRFMGSKKNTKKEFKTKFVY
jgi:two-component system sensor histidine kinase AgrC